MSRIKKNHLYMYAASIAFVGLSPSAWGMDYLSSWVEGEDRVKSKVVSSLVPQILPPLQNGECIKTSSREPVYDKLLMLNSAQGIIKATFQKGNQSYEYFGSGTLIAPNLVLTSANNLYNIDIHEDKPVGQAKNVKFYPLINREGNFLAVSNVKDFYFTEEYTKDRSENYGLLVLENPIGEMTGYLGVNVLPPEEKILGTNMIEFDQNYIHYQMNKSGSGIFYKDKHNNHFLIGVHTTGDETLGINTAILLTKPRYEKIRTWVKDSFEKVAVPTLTKGMFSSVESANLESKYIGNSGVNTLCNYATNLHTINLSHNSIGEGGCYPFLTLPTLTALNLSSNKIGNDGFRLLMHHTSLRELDISNNYITLNNISGDVFENSSLLSLDLSWNLIEQNGGMIFAQHPYLTNLNLSNNKINDAGKVLLALAKNTHLKTLSFSNPYDLSTSGKALAKMGKAAGMMGRTGAVVSVVALTGAAVGLGVTGTAVVLADKIGGALVTSIVNQATLWSVLSGATSGAINGAITTQVVIIEAGATIGALGGLGVGTVTGVDVNTKLSEMDSLESKIMYLGGKFAIGREEAQALSENTSLTDLDLSDNQITADIVAILINSPSITSLNLSWNELNDKDAKNISSILEKNKILTCMNLQNNNIKDQEIQKTINNLLINNVVLKEQPTTHQFFEGRKDG